MVFIKFTNYLLELNTVSKQIEKYNFKNRNSKFKNRIERIEISAKFLYMNFFFKTYTGTTKGKLFIVFPWLVKNLSITSSKKCLNFIFVFSSATNITVIEQNMLYAIEVLLSTLTTTFFWQTWSNISDSRTFDKKYGTCIGSGLVSRFSYRGLRKCPISLIQVQSWKSG